MKHHTDKTNIVADILLRKELLPDRGRKETTLLP